MEQEKPRFTRHSEMKTTKSEWKIASYWSA